MFEPQMSHLLSKSKIYRQNQLNFWHTNIRLFTLSRISLGGFFAKPSKPVKATKHQLHHSFTTHYILRKLCSSVLPRGRNFGRRTQKGPYKNLCGRKNWRPNFLEICQKRAEKGPNFFEDDYSYKKLKYLQKSTLHLLISLIFSSLCREK
jgi:hypothetical protein